MKTVIEMAKEAGLHEARENPPYFGVSVLTLERFVELVRADEREAMATEAAKQGWAMKNEDPFEDAVREIAAIRARSNK